jgi:hypothetical protein
MPLMPPLVKRMPPLARWICPLVKRMPSLALWICPLAKLVLPLSELMPPLAISGLFLMLPGLPPGGRTYNF